MAASKPSSSLRLTRSDQKSRRHKLRGKNHIKFLNSNILFQSKYHGSYVYFIGYYSIGLSISNSHPIQLLAILQESSTL